MQSEIIIVVYTLKE